MGGLIQKLELTISKQEPCDVSQRHVIAYKVRGSAFLLEVPRSVAQFCNVMAIHFGLVAKPFATTLAKKFSGTVVERWTRYRAECFFEGFVQTIAGEASTGIETQDLDKRLDEVLSDDTKNEVLFDAYRRVCLSKSKTLGPRIIGLLTGQVVSEGRVADKMEERIFEAAESMSDGDFIEFMKGYRNLCDPLFQATDSSRAIRVPWSEEEADSSRDLNISPFNWEEALGRWAVKLNAVGLLDVDVRQQTIAANSFDPDPGLVRINIKTTVIASGGCAELYDLLLRCLGPSPATPETQNV